MAWKLKQKQREDNNVKVAVKHSIFQSFTFIHAWLSFAAYSCRHAKGNANSNANRWRERMKNDDEDSTEICLINENWFSLLFFFRQTATFVLLNLKVSMYTTFRENPLRGRRKSESMARFYFVNTKHHHYKFARWWKRIFSQKIWLDF